jgi:hypothetical protein
MIVPCDYDHLSLFKGAEHDDEPSRDKLSPHNLLPYNLPPDDASLDVVFAGWVCLSGKRTGTPFVRSR